jgi:hypothetical protein
VDRLARRNHAHGSALTSWPRITKWRFRLNTNSVTVGSPSAQEVLVTLPLVGPAGCNGCDRSKRGASTWDEISGKPATFPPSAHEHQPDQVYADAAFVSQSGDSSLQIGIYLHNGTDNGRPVYESPTTGDYIWWDSNLDQWYLTSRTDVNLYYLDENADEFPWETDVVWNAIPPQTGNIEVDQAFLSDISDYSVASVIGLKTSKSGNASSTELVLGSDTRLTNSRTPSSTLAHASTHHTGGSDAVTAFSIGAESIFDATGNTLTGTPVTLTASRARVWTLICFSSTTVTLPTTGVELGDRIVLRGGSPVTAAISITSTGVSDTIQNTDEQFSYTYLSTGIGPRWIKNLVDNHDASRVNSGTVANARINFAAPAAIGSTTPNTLAGTQLALHDGSDTGTFVAASKLTANRTYDLPDASGTIALTSDITGGGTKTYAVFTATDNQPPATAYATLDTRNSIAVLDFDDATDESAVFVSIIPEAASLGSGLKIRLHWMATTATSGDVVWDVSLERMTTDLDSDSFDTIASGTAAANGTSGILTVTEITLTTIDSVTAGDGYRLKITRDADNGSDSMSGDAELVVCEVRSAA